MEIDIDRIIKEERRINQNELLILFKIKELIKNAKYDIESIEKIIDDLIKENYEELRSFTPAGREKEKIEVLDKKLSSVMELLESIKKNLEEYKILVEKEFF